MFPASLLGPGCNDGSHCLLPTIEISDSHELNHMHLPRDSMAIPHMMVGQRILVVKYSRTVYHRVETCILFTKRI